MQEIRPQSVPRPFLLPIGIALLVIFEALLVAHVNHWLPAGELEELGALIRWNITPFAWCAYLLVLLGLLTRFDRRNWLRRFRNRFLVCWLWAVPAWCYFDWMNFYFMRDHETGLRAWEYERLPLDFGDRLVGYLIAFGAIAPGMFLTGDVLQRMGFQKIRTRSVSEGRVNSPKSVLHSRLTFLTFVLGVALTPIPIFIGTPASNLAIWVGTWALLDPINRYFGRPSILTDWFEGRWGRTLALGLGGLLCGFLWEFWNYWAFTKWTYHLPFLGRFENYRYFEMPLPGLVGFIAFGLETWAMWQTSLLILSPFVEGESKAPRSLADQTHHDYACL